MYIYIYRVGGIPTPLKNRKVNWDDYSLQGKMKHVPNHQPNIHRSYALCVCLHDRFDPEACSTSASGD